MLIHRPARPASRSSKGFFIFQRRKMTTKETADALGVSESTIQRHAKELGLTENGKQTELDERAVTIIKTKIERSGRTDLRNVAELPATRVVG